MSDLPRTPPPGEELDLGEIEAETLDDEADLLDPADQTDDGAEEEGDGQGEPEEEDVAAAPRGGGARTPRVLRRRAQEAERERDELRRTVRELSQRQQDFETRLANDPAARQRQEQQEREYLLTRTPEEQIQYFNQKTRNDLAEALRIQEVRFQDTFDRSEYEREARVNRTYAQYRTRVEDTLRAARSQGINVTRRDVLEKLIGQDILEGAAAAGPGQRAAGAGRVRRATTRPGNGRGDSAAARRPSDDSYESAMARVKGQPLF